MGRVCRSPAAPLEEQELLSFLFFFFWKDHGVYGEGLQQNLTSILLGTEGVGEGEPNNKTQRQIAAVKATWIQ